MNMMRIMIMSKIMIMMILSYDYFIKKKIVIIMTKTVMTAATTKEITIMNII